MNPQYNIAMLILAATYDGISYASKQKLVDSPTVHVAGCPEIFQGSGLAITCIDA